VNFVLIASFIFSYFLIFIINAPECKRLSEVPVLHQDGLFVVLHRFIYLFIISALSISIAPSPALLVSEVQDYNVVLHAVLLISLYADNDWNFFPRILFVSLCMLG
jgi:hypothetical protein